MQIWLQTPWVLIQAVLTVSSMNLDKSLDSKPSSTTKLMLLLLIVDNDNWAQEIKYPLS